jgi:hypothetical protein
MNAAYLGTTDFVCKATGPLIRILSGGATLRVFATFGTVLGLPIFSRPPSCFLLRSLSWRPRNAVAQRYSRSLVLQLLLCPGLQGGRRYIRHGSSTSLQRYANLQPRSAPPTRLGTIFVSDAGTPQHFVSALRITNSQEGGWQKDSETDFWRETSEELGNAPQGTMNSQAPK